MFGWTRSVSGRLALALVAALLSVWMARAVAELAALAVMAALVLWVVRGQRRELKASRAENARLREVLDAGQISVGALDRLDAPVQNRGALPFLRRTR